MDKKYIRSDPANVEVILSDSEQSQESRRIPLRLLGTNVILNSPALPRGRIQDLDSGQARMTAEILRSDNIRPCPQCEGLTLSGMPGGRDAICPNCGYKDPCCYD